VPSRPSFTAGREFGGKRDARERWLDTCLRARAGVSRSRRRVVPCVPGATTCGSAGCPESSAAWRGKRCPGSVCSVCYFGRRSSRDRCRVRPPRRFVLCEAGSPIDSWWDAGVQRPVPATPEPPTTNFQPFARAKPSLTPMRRGRLPNDCCRHATCVYRLERSSGRNASPRGITPSNIPSPIQSQHGSRTKVGPGARAQTQTRTHPPPPRDRRHPAPTPEALDTPTPDK
jgi:hypothetical protein